MAHDSLRKSVFELVNDLGLDVVAFGGEFHSIEEEDETDQPERSVRARTHLAQSRAEPSHFPRSFRPNAAPPALHPRWKPRVTTLSPHHSLLCM